jgi:hypothetical protein
MTVNKLDGGPAGGAPRTSRPRILIGYLAVVGILPYLILKILWVFGSDVGIYDRSGFDDPFLVAANWVTLGMDAIAVVAALALTHRWGARLPAWLVLFPVWVAAGLLVPRVVVAPLYLLAQPATDPANEQPQLIANWVYVMVSCSFAAQGAAILASFALYCRARWGTLLLEPAGRRRLGATHPFQTVVVAACCGFAGLITVLGGVGALLVSGDERATELVGWASATTWIVVALAGALILVRKVGRGLRLWVPLGMILVGTGSMVWWGIWGQILLLAPSALTDTTQQPLVGIAGFGGVCIGLVLALVAAFTVVEQVGQDLR